jgi:hypothetical protein
MTRGILRPGAGSVRAAILFSCLFTGWSAAAQSSDADDNAPLTGTAIAAATLPIVLPPRLIECEGNGLCNGAWTLEGSKGSAVWFTQSPTRAKLTVMQSDPGEILIRRTDLTDGNSAVYHGRLQGDTYSGAVIWSKPDHPGFASGHWTATVPEISCDPHSRMSSEDAKRIGQNALMFDHWRDAFDCYLEAADAGDVTAQTVVGFIFYNGRKGDVPQDYAQALVWLGKAADAGIYPAQVKVSDMYTLGQGTAKDPELAAFYGKKAAEQKRDRERQEDRADRAADRAANEMTGFVMGAVFGSMWF